MRKTILGVDPGFSVSGFCVLRAEHQKTMIVDCSYLKLSSSKSLSERTGIFYRFFTEKITAWSVTHIALETSFLGKNAQTFLKLGYLRGILYLLADQHHATIMEYAPREIKQAVTGFGGAQKDQVARIVMQLFPQLGVQEKTDVTDAIAISLCALWRQ